MGPYEELGVPVRAYGEYEHTLTPEVLRDVQAALRTAHRDRSLLQDRKAS